MSHLEASIPQAASSSNCLTSPVTQRVWMGSTQHIFKILIFMVCLGSLGKKAQFFGRKDCYGFLSCGSESEFLALQLQMNLPDEKMRIFLPFSFANCQAEDAQPQHHHRGLRRAVGHGRFELCHLEKGLGGWLPMWQDIKLSDINDGYHML